MLTNGSHANDIDQIGGAMQRITLQAKSTANGRAAIWVVRPKSIRNRRFVAEHHEVHTMSIAVQAVYEDGIFRPLTPLKLVEGSQVEVTIPEVLPTLPENPSQNLPLGFANRRLLPEFAALGPIAGDTTLEISEDRN